MPEIKKHPIAAHMRERAMFDEGRVTDALACVASHAEP